MVSFLKKLVFFVLFFEGILFLVLYCFGPNGLHVVSSLQDQKSHINKEIIHLRSEIEALRQDIAFVITDFAKEKMARERLLMKKNNETVYFKKSMRSKNV